MIALCLTRGATHRKLTVLYNHGREAPPSDRPRPLLQRPDARGPARRLERVEPRERNRDGREVRNPGEERLAANGVAVVYRAGTDGRVDDERDLSVADGVDDVRAALADFVHDLAR